MFELKAPYQPAGDQPKAIAELINNLQTGRDHQVLLGVTGSGKTYTVANVIQSIQKPTLVVAHNKTLAAQLYQEFRDFFPNNAVSYFVSYYDYYQPEAYIVSSDTYIEKEAMINDEIDKLRLAATANLLSRPDTIVVASVSCIYNLGNPEDFDQQTLTVVVGELVSQSAIMRLLVDMQYQRVTTDLHRGSFRTRGEHLQVWPANEPWAMDITFINNEITAIRQFDATTGETWQSPPAANRDETPNQHRYRIYPAKHYVAGHNNQPALQAIEHDLQIRLAELKAAGKSLEAYRLEQRTMHDLDMIREIGFVNGIENYSRYFDGREPGTPPFTLLDYFAYNAKKFGDGQFLTVLDECHITLPQVRGMYFGDRSRKETLIEYGFRLPAAIDNRPLRFDEFLDRVPLTIAVSATPDTWEIEHAQNTVVEQIVRPTGLIDPEVEIRPIDGQIPDLLHEIVVRKAKGQRALVTTLTKKMAETLTEYMNDAKKMNALLVAHGYDPAEQMPKVQYLHSDVDTLDRTDILEDLRRGVYDVLVGVNLLREGLDLPEVTLVAILDADQEGFLRSAPALIQTMGRAARHIEGRVILYADRITRSMQTALDEVARRRTIQLAYNEEHHITALSISKPVRDRLVQQHEEDTSMPGFHEERRGYRAQKSVSTADKTVVSLSQKRSVILEDIDSNSLTPQDKEKLVRQLNRSMNGAAKAWNFELAAQIRDTIAKLSA
jgi:excinuclease ABC subunit B